MTDGEPARLTILAGLPGAGKTTWLARQLEDGPLRGVHVLANAAGRAEAEQTPAGARGLRRIGPDCACCAGAAAFRAALADLLDEGARHIVLEAAGQAEPGRIAAAIGQDAALAGRIAVGETIVVLDATSGRSLVEQDGTAMRQLRAADAVVLSRPDRAGAAELRRLAGWLRRIAPQAHLFAAEKGEERVLPQAGAGDETAALVELDAGAPLSAVMLWISALLHARGEEVRSIRGVVAGTEGPVLVVADGRSVDLSDPEPGDVAGTLRIEGRGLDAETVARSLRAFGVTARPAEA